VKNLDSGATKWQLWSMAESGLNPTAAALLGLLHDGPMTGGQLMSAAQRRLGSYWSMTRSQVYRELPALADAGYVKLGKPGARSSQPYSITPAGKRAFVRWLGEPAAREVLRSPLALRVAFGAHQSASQLQQAYSQATEYHNTALNVARDQAKEAKKAGDDFGAGALDLAVAYHRAALTWLKNAPSK
jgi:DNA-binding PadR family transcriptional regulator